MGQDTKGDKSDKGVPHVRDIENNWQVALIKSDNQEITLWVVSSWTELCPTLFWLPGLTMQTMWGLDGIAINCSIPRMRLCFVPHDARKTDSLPLEILLHKFLLSISISLYSVIYKHKPQQVETTHFPIVSSSKLTTPGVTKQIIS